MRETPDNAESVAEYPLDVARKLADLCRAAYRVANEAETTIYMGRMECSVEAIHALQAALRALDGTAQYDGEASHGAG